MTDIIPPEPTDSIVKEKGTMFDRFMNWTQDVSNATNLNTVIDGTGSPEGVITANGNKFYRDTSGPNLYWKSTDGGDTGWLLVV